MEEPELALLRQSVRLLDGKEMGIIGSLNIITMVAYRTGTVRYYQFIRVKQYGTLLSQIEEEYKTGAF